MTDSKKAREQKDGDYTHIVVVLDRSGSMRGLKADTIGGFNDFLAKQQEVKGKGTLTMVHFADDQRFIEDMSPLENLKALTNETYDPSGSSTALLDTIGRTINRIENTLNGLEQKPDKVVFVIITDGQENSSREFSRSQIMEMIKRHEDEMDWDFVFIGANQDAIAEGSNMGVRATNSLNYDASHLGVKCMYSSLTSNMTNYREIKRSKSGEKIGFFASPDTEETEDTEETIN